MKTTRKIAAGLSTLVLVLTPFSMVFAQEIPPPAPTIETSVPEQQSPITTVSPSDTPVTLVDASATQDTLPAPELTNTGNPASLNAGTESQATLPSDTLVSTEDPNQLEGGGSGGVSTPIDQGVPTDTTPIVSTPSDTTPNTTPLVPETPPEPVPLEPDPALTEPADQPVVADLPVRDIPPKKTFTFAIGTGRIATKHALAWKGGGSETKDAKGRPVRTNADTITATPAVSIDPVAEVPVISGSCSDEYYVILLYKNQTDYDQNPGAYILNNAYPCVNGSYSYEIKKIPASIPTGTYYLLVGQMGGTRAWTPITSLVPITVVHT